MDSSSLLAKYTPGGSQTLSKMANRYPQNYPKVLTNGYKGHVWDEQSREYIDLISGLGAISVGYSNRLVNDAVEEQLQRGVTFSLPTIMEKLSISIKVRSFLATEKLHIKLLTKSDK